MENEWKMRTDREVSRKIGTDQPRKSAFARTGTLVRCAFQSLKKSVYTTNYATYVRHSAGRAFAVLAAGHVCRALRFITFSNDGNGCRAVLGGNLNADMMVDNMLPLRFRRLAILVGLLCGWTGHSSSSLRLCTRSTSSVRLRGNRLQGTRASLLRKVQDGQLGIGICP
jgi:hypothetical protein